MQKLCKSCKSRHLPPTGKKCRRKEQDYEQLSDAAVAGSLPASQSAQAVQDDGQRLQAEILHQLKKVTEIGPGGTEGGGVTEELYSIG